jgi:hypothetical protein
MTDNITLPRAVVEQIREAFKELDYASEPYVNEIARTALAALDAALAEPPAICSAQDNEAALERIANKVKPGQVKGLLPEAPAKPEPVHPGYVIGASWLETAYSRIAAGEAEDAVLTEVLGARGWAKREPATREQVFAAYDRNDAIGFWNYCDAWREAERFHGIGGSKT